ncbi:hypothetical protein [Mycolicibacterium lutetiense]|uniref:Transmembrane protein n=1 Tax=Mycolicibacterium lutetiense TaxID=1641992 RepID=A0ABS4ZSK2_9MYCO|nr:hypothetical protein [Mycolicibacterium lutetiense]MBP2452503.1 hypothetical protein [Mycolicibacterium lutetiense]
MSPTTAPTPPAPSVPYWDVDGIIRAPGLTREQLSRNFDAIRNSPSADLDSLLPAPVTSPSLTWVWVGLVAIAAIVMVVAVVAVLVRRRRRPTHVGVDVVDYPDDDPFTFTPVTDGTEPVPPPPADMVTFIPADADDDTDLPPAPVNTDR